jgi:hypothetical protein
MAEAITGCVKYGQQGLAFNMKGLSGTTVADLSRLAEHSIARKTWSTYRTAERMLATFCKAKGRALELPLSENTTLEFIHWLMFVRGLSAASVSGYLAGIRKLHIIKGLEEPKLRSNLVQMVIDGKKNVEAAVRLQEGRKRQAMTPDIMALLKARVREWEADKLDKLAVWAVSTLLFHGAFRGAEILARHAATFDPAYTLLRKDLCIIEREGGKAEVQVLVKAPKESRDSGSVIVDIFETGTEMCPVKATKKWWKVSKHMDPDQPAFRLACGTPLTGSRFNGLLRGWLADTVPGISCHSFRIGAASLMGKLGFADNDVKAIGRWGSRAFEGYMRMPRTKRRLVAEKFAKYGK